MFSYYGSKSKIIKYYSTPKYDTIIEPFAGSAQYAFKYWEKNVILIEKDELIFDIWNWLINEATIDSVMSLSLFKQGETITAPNAIIRNLISLESGRGCCPRRTGANLVAGKYNRWSDNGGKGRKRLADNLHKIKHWKVIHGDYSIAPDIYATWFVDPPYSNFAGERYNYNCKQIDYTKLGLWCKSLKGQITVCEELLAEWLPFEFLCMGIGQKKDLGCNIEAVWEKND